MHERIGRLEAKPLSLDSPEERREGPEENQPTPAAVRGRRRRVAARFAGDHEGAWQGVQTVLPGVPELPQVK